MVNLFKRMRKLNTLLDVRVGTGAATFPSAASATNEFPAITRLHLTYARKIYGGHQGARHFWRNCLPRLKFHNPSVQMTVKQTDNQDGPAVLTIYFSEKLSNAASLSPAKIEDKFAPQPGETEKAAVMDVRNLTYKEIWAKVKMMTGAAEIAATAQEEAELKKLEQMRVQAEKDRVRVAGIRQAKKDQERMLQEARGEVERLKQM
ncbi:50S ribosomal protein [Aspergillus ochraceoroseus]|uniref:50S ribosomal protein n=1 Tax=Aspergillus ochraceoroseus TaxID=138278 RepID=A0A0F8XH68_9EURO|nr:50S ribosomal protein [Aspergillus ochraceoroseus]